MSTHVRTLIIGAGQAGLALSRCLTDRAHEHLVLDRGRVAERWRSERWDSFRLLTPNWLTRLPGYRYTGGDPDGFMTGREVIDFFDGYARSFQPPVRTGVTVTAVEPGPRGWVVRIADRELLHAANVVVAVGHYNRPEIPDLAAHLPAEVHQLHSSEYRNPGLLPDGAVVVVGSGPSGQQVADELAMAGRRVYLAVGRHRPLPRRYRGHDVYWWLDRTGMLDRTVDTLPSAAVTRNAPSGVLAGEPRDLNLRRLVARGVVAAGRLAGVDGARLTFAGDLPDRLAEADGNTQRLLTRVDEYVRRAGLAASPPDRPDPPPAPWADLAPRRLELDRSRVSTVIWATGYRRDYSWISAPVFDADHEPVHRRGITPAAGLYFLGLRWLYRRKSNIIDGVGPDAEYLAEHLSREPATVSVG
ncbi:MAG TPA: NAD(P)-binding domain-containing protein [Jiangellaceae bacterium]|nr:NAD(P)-binding domain-containing protein [Jiangellaceae bacterium]